MYVYVFFFKQKTAYEMRISDWSSDVCSSDLFRRHGPVRRSHAGVAAGGPAGACAAGLGAVALARRLAHRRHGAGGADGVRGAAHRGRRCDRSDLAQPVAVRDPDGRRAGVGAGAGAVAGAQAVRRGARAMSGLDLLGVLLLLGFGAGVLAVARTSVV